MSRYFLEVAYKGTRYSGFQIQQNANTVQAEIEKAFHLLQRQAVILTGSSRTDAGVHALQNYFHFDFDDVINPHFVYKMNAILPDDIVVKQVKEMPPEAHSRFDAISREYEYAVYQYKNPFLKDRAFYYPYKLDMEKLHWAANYIKTQTYFFSFSKTNTQVSNFYCTILDSFWQQQEGKITYHIKGNRFLRGMVRLLTATMLKLGRGNMDEPAFEKLFSMDNVKCGFSVPAHGLFLKGVNYPQDYFSSIR